VALGPATDAQLEAELLHGRGWEGRRRKRFARPAGTYGTAGDRP
jgi:hypothetical protein